MGRSALSADGSSISAASGRVALGTIASRQFMPFVRVLAESFRRFHPDVPIFVIMAEPDDEPDQPVPFERVPIEAIGLPPLERYWFQYSVAQVVISAKAALLRYLLDRGFERAVFLDGDILVLGDLSTLLWPASRQPIALTPHRLWPSLAHTAVRDESTLLLSGVFNGGFVAVSESDVARRFLAWWHARLATHCRYDLSVGLHNDQTWLSLVPALFEDCAVVRDPGANVAYWNVDERAVACDGDLITVRGEPARFFHFSGYDPARPDRMTRYRPSWGPEDAHGAWPLFERYQAHLVAAGWRPSSQSEPYQVFDNGVRIPAIVRRVFLEQRGQEGRFGNPFITAGPSSFFEWLQTPAGSPGIRPAVSNFWLSVHDLRPDLCSAFPDPLGRDRAAFLDWTAAYGVAELGVADLIAAFELVAR